MVLTDPPHDLSVLGTRVAVGQGLIHFFLEISPAIPTTVVQDPTAKGVDVASSETSLLACLAAGPLSILPMDLPCEAYDHPDGAVQDPRLQGPRTQMPGFLVFEEQHGL